MWITWNHKIDSQVYIKYLNIKGHEICLHENTKQIVIDVNYGYYTFVMNEDTDMNLIKQKIEDYIRKESILVLEGIKSSMWVEYEK